MHASPEVLEAIGVAANIYNGWDNTITSNGSKLKVGQGYASNNFYHPRAKRENISTR